MSVCVCFSSAHPGGLALFKWGARLLQTEGEEDGEGDVNKERSLLPAWTDNSSEERVEGRKKMILPVYLRVENILLCNLSHGAKYFPPLVLRPEVK